MAKDTKKETKYLYECDLCGKDVTHLLAFCACDKCDEMLRKHIKHYKNERKKIEQTETARKHYLRNLKRKKGLLG